MALWRRPRNELGKHHVPENCRKYHYRSGESFVSIARKFEMDPLELIQLNFRTTNPREVNYYLREHCGCTRETRSGKNYVFSTGDRRNKAGEASYLWVPRSASRLPVVVEGKPPSGLWFGLGVRVDAGAGVSLSPLYAYLFSHDRFGDNFLLYMDGRSATVGAAFGATPVLVVASGVYSPWELHDYFYEGDWDLQLKLGANWGKILKGLKGSSKAGPLVEKATRLGRTRLSSLVESLRRQGKAGDGLASAVQKAARLSPDDWADLRTAFNSLVGLGAVKARQSEPRLDVLEIPVSFGAALAVARMRAECSVMHVRSEARGPVDPEAATSAARFEE